MVLAESGAGDACSLVHNRTEKHTKADLACHTSFTRAKSFNDNKDSIATNNNTYL
jgi:hypothetical protein